MAATAASVKALGGAAFSGLSDATVDLWIDTAERLLSESVFGTRYDDAVTFWVLHQLACTQLSGAGAGGASGAVTSTKVGNVSVNYGTSSASTSSSTSSQFSKTTWGQLFLSIVHAVAPGVSIANTVQPT